VPDALERAWLARLTPKWSCPVTTTRPGRVKVAGMDLSYDLGWHTGSQRTGGVVVVISRR
jgi:hypothetical protein